MKLNVLSYGATGNGVTDDQPAFAAALAAAQPGDVIEVPSGTYRLAQTLDIDSSVTLQGEGINDTVLQAEASSGPGVLISGAGAVVGLQSLSITASGIARALEISATISLNSDIRRLQITGATEAQIAVTGPLINTRLEHLTLSGGQYGLATLDGGYVNAVSIHGIRVSNTQTAAIFLENLTTSVRALSIFGGTLEGNLGPGLYANGGWVVNVYGGYFESNCQNTGPADIVLGSQTAAVCEVMLQGANFSSAGAAQGNVRVAWHNVRGRLNAFGGMWPDATEIDVAGFSIGSRANFVATQAVPTTLNAPNGTTSQFPPEVPFGNGYVNLRDYTVGNGTDDSVAFSAALADARTNGVALYCPPGDQVYRLADISLQSRDRILCELNTRVRGVNTNSTIFLVEGAASYIQVEGGQWENCEVVFRHDKTLADGALSSCTFKNMFLAANANVAFDIDVILGSFWTNCEFRSVGRAVQINGERQSNILKWENCKFLTGAGVRLSDGGSSCGRWSFDGCWFEQMNGPPIEILMSMNNLSVVDSYFEQCPGIVLNTPVTQFVRGFVFDGNFISQPTEDVVVWLGSDRIQSPRTRDNYNVQFATSDILVRSDTLEVVDGEVAADPERALVVDGVSYDLGSDEFGAFFNTVLSSLDRNVSHQIRIRGQHDISTPLDLTSFRGGLVVDARDSRLVWTSLTRGACLVDLTDALGVTIWGGEWRTASATQRCSNGLQLGRTSTSAYRSSGGHRFIGVSVVGWFDNAAMASISSENCSDVSCHLENLYDSGRYVLYLGDQPRAGDILEAPYGLALDHNGSESSTAWQSSMIRLEGDVTEAPICVNGFDGVSLVDAYVAQTDNAEQHLLLTTEARGLTGFRAPGLYTQAKNGSSPAWGLTIDGLPNNAATDVEVSFQALGHTRAPNFAAGLARVLTINEVRNLRLSGENEAIFFHPGCSAYGIDLHTRTDLADVSSGDDAEGSADIRLGLYTQGRIEMGHPDTRLTTTPGGETDLLVQSPEGTRVLGDTVSAFLSIDGKNYPVTSSNLVSSANSLLGSLNKSEYHDVRIFGEATATAALDFSNFVGGIVIDATGLRLTGWSLDSPPITIAGSVAVRLVGGRYRLTGEGIDRPLIPVADEAGATTLS